MVRIGVVFAVLLFATSRAATAESPAERGRYLVNTIMACGNCHTPRAADGRPIVDQALSGGLTFTTPAFAATAWSRGVSDFTTGLGRGGHPFPPREGTPEGTPPSIAATSPRIRPPASAPGPIRKSVARSRKEFRATGERSSRRWLSAFTPT